MVSGQGGKQPGTARKGGSGGRGPGPGGVTTAHLPKVEVTWDFEGGGYCCPDCGEAFARLGDHVVEQLDWQVVVRLRRALPQPVPAGLPVPGGRGR